MKLHIVNKKKFIRSLLIILGVMLLSSIMISSNASSSIEVTYSKLYVIEGDTLWSIATEESKTNAYYENFDIRDIIHDLKKINHLQNTSLQIGQELYIPNI